jgi:hypothetical protein
VKARVASRLHVARIVVRPRRSPALISAPRSYGVADSFTVLNQGSFDYATTPSTHDALNILSA